MKSKINIGTISVILIFLFFGSIWIMKNSEQSKRHKPVSLKKISAKKSVQAEIGITEDDEMLAPLSVSFLESNGDSLWQMDRSWYYRNTNTALNSLLISQSNESYVLSYKWWNNYTRHTMRINYRLNRNEFDSAVFSREIIKDFDFTNSEERAVNRFFLYSELFMKSRNALKPLCESFRNLPVYTREYRTELAYNVITFIQNLQYIYHFQHTVKDDSLFCKLKYFEGPEDDNSQCTYCEPLYHPERAKAGREIRFDIFSPVEFIKHKKGDCDSRTVLAYTLLKSLGFDVAIINISFDEGRHSMLGIADVKHLDKFYFTLNGKKYYFVELTGTERYIGELTSWEEDYFAEIIALPYPKTLYGTLKNQGM
ncbi:MAG: hypothetical protein WCT77_04675 [Bacteroidota bacterium]